MTPNTIQTPNEPNTPRRWLPYVEGIFSLVRVPKGEGSGAPGFGAGAECLGAEALLALLKNYARAADRKVAITVGAPAHPYTPQCRHLRHRCC